MKKIIRNRSDEAGQAFWASAEVSAQGVRDWPDWKKAGITAEQPGVVLRTAVDVVEDQLVTPTAATIPGAR